MGFKMKFAEKIEAAGKKLRISLFKPILFIFTKTGLNANHLSAIGLAFASASFYFIIAGNLAAGLWLFAAAFLLDMLDGSLSRYQKNSSDKGKFLDMTVDSLVSSMIALALMIKGAVRPAEGSIFIYLMLITIIFACIINSKKYKTDWLFHPRAGFLAHLPKNILFAGFVLWALGVGINLNWVAAALDIYLGSLAVAQFAFIWKKF